MSTGECSAGAGTAALRALAQQSAATCRRVGKNDEISSASSKTIIFRQAGAMPAAGGVCVRLICLRAANLASAAGSNFKAKPVPVCSSFSVKQALLDGHDEGGSAAMLGSIATVHEMLFSFGLRFLADCCK